VGGGAHLKHRDLLFVGSVPLRPASAVFAALAEGVAELAPRYPDGEQAGWVEGIFPQLVRHPALRVDHLRRMANSGPFNRELPILGLADRASADTLKLGPFGIAENALRSYEDFSALKARGRIPRSTRFQATIPAPFTCCFILMLDPDDVARIAGDTLAEELDRIITQIPHQELTVQLDLAVEIGREEDLRRPALDRIPLSQEFKWTRAQSLQAVAHLAARVPPTVELGVHICGRWHLETSVGQDMAVHVEFANALANAIPRRLDYIHIPTIPSHDEHSLAPLAQLQLSPGTKLYLGVLHASDGLEGAQRRIRAAERWVKDFGLAHWCGLSQWGAGPETVAPMLQLHRACTELS